MLEVSFTFVFSINNNFKFYNGCKIIIYIDCTLSEAVDVFNVFNATWVNRTNYKQYKTENLNKKCWFNYHFIVKDNYVKSSLVTDNMLAKQLMWYNKYSISFCDVWCTCIPHTLSNIIGQTYGMSISCLHSQSCICSKWHQAVLKVLVADQFLWASTFLHLSAFPNILD